MAALCSALPEAQEHLNLQLKKKEEEKMSKKNSHRTASRHCRCCAKAGGTAQSVLLPTSVFMSSICDCNASEFCCLDNKVQQFSDLAISLEVACRAS